MSRISLETSDVLKLGWSQPTLISILVLALTPSLMDYAQVESEGEVVDCTASPLRYYLQGTSLRIRYATSKAEHLIHS
jgi:hypothetical protein